MDLPLQVQESIPPGLRYDSVVPVHWQVRRQLRHRQPVNTHVLNAQEGEPQLFMLKFMNE